MKNKKVKKTQLFLYNIIMKTKTIIDMEKDDYEYIGESELKSRGWTPYKRKWYLWGTRELTKRNENGELLYLREMVEEMERKHRRDFDKSKKVLEERFNGFGMCKLRRF